jgi:rhodanese-related sulfurtransferase
MAQGLRITIEEVKKRMDAGEHILFVDSRNPAEWGMTDRKIPGAIRVGVGEVAEKITTIPEGALIVAYCT